MGNARDKAAAAVGVSPRYIQDAKKIEACAPELAAQVRADAANMLNVSTRTVAAAAKVRSEAPDAIVQAVEQGTVSRRLWPFLRGLATLLARL